MCNYILVFPLHVYMSPRCVWCLRRSEEELDLQMVVSCQEGAGA